jgi:transcriptional regulator with GAF, ATPase, and Fis domain/serine/threonine protein kinase/tetratricopeptide (TPR) repeat protein
MEAYPRLGRYRLLAKLGDSESSSVYIGESLDSGQQFAVKIFDDGIGASHVSRIENSKLFLQELEVLSISAHPNLVRLIDFGQTLGELSDFLILEYLRGETFITASKDASQHHFYSMIIQVCRALDFLHSRGIAHGDLKPQNILVVQDGDSDRKPPTVKLVDLAYATTKKELTAGSRLGTPHYMAPEIIMGQRPTIECDLYSLGAILFECLMGNPPFPGPGIGATLQQHLQDVPPRIDSAALRELHPIIYQLLSKDPSRRPHSPAEVIRLVNHVSPVGRFPLNTHETWDAQAKSCPLVGRDEVISASSRIMMDIASRSHGSRPHSIVIMGEKGSGKSRLVKEVAIAGRSLGYRVISLPATTNTLNTEWARSAIEDFLAEEPPRPILITYDGLIACTSHTSKMLETLLVDYRHSRLLLIVTADTSDIPEVQLDSALERLRHTSQCVLWNLLPFNDSHLSQLITNAVKSSTVDARLASLFGAHTGGNPLLTIELIIACLDQGITFNHSDSLLVPRHFDTLTLPKPVTNHLEHLLDKMSLDESAVLDLLAAAQDGLKAGDIAVLTNREPNSVAISCRQLERRGVARLDRRDDYSRYTISSELLRATVLQKLCPDSKRLLYERLAEWYVSNLDADRSIEHAASSYVAAGRQQEAIRYCTMAASKAESNSELSRAVLFQRLAMDQRPQDPITRAEIAFGLALLLRRLGKISESLHVLDGIIVDTELPAALRARIHVCRARCQMDMGDFLSCLNTARNGLKIARRADLPLESIQAMLQVGFALCSLEQRQLGQRVLFRAAVKARRAGFGIKSGIAFVDVASSFWKAGNYRRALNYQRRAYRLIRNRGAPADEALALFNIGVLLSELGLYRRSRSSHRNALNTAKREGQQTLVATVSINIGETYRAQGQWPIALRHYRTAAKALDGQGADLALLTADSNMAYAFARAGHYEEARRCLRHRMRAARRLGSTQAACFLLVSWSVVLLSTGRYASTGKVTALACRHAERAGLWGSILELRVLMALSMAADGKPEEARNLLSSAIESFKNRAPFEITLGADIALSRIEHSVGGSMSAIERRLDSVIQLARSKRMRWHLASALMLRVEDLLATHRAEEAESVAHEAREISDSIADRTLYWQASYLLGRAFEQRLQYERALTSYRAAALTIHELAMNLEDETYKIPFLEQPKVHEVLERYDRLRGEVGKRARLDLASMSRSEKISRRMLGALNAIGHKLASILDLNELLAYLLDLSIENVRAERGIIFLRDEANGEMLIECARGMDKESLEEVSSFSSSVIRQVAQGQTLLTVDVGMDPTLSAYKSLVLHEIKSILCVPMRARGKVTGVIYLDTRRAAQLFADKERAFVESFASQAAIAIENARLFGQMSAENVRLRKEVEGRSRFENLVGTSPAMKRLTDTISGVLNSDCGVLIVGESGTGKELVARAIHYNGPRRKKDFVAIDCGALPESLLEAELFGYVRGAFTGADKDRVGLIEQAQGGTLFLDEITNTSLALQARLLRVLQEHEVRRVGENRPRQVDVRVIAATNSDIMSLVKSGRFRQDLYYRLDVVTIEVPALRERREDIPLLVDHLLKGHDKGGMASKRLGPGVLRALSDYNWPGNVRELQNVIQRAVVLAAGSVITVEHLPAVLRESIVSTGSGGNGNGSKTGEQLMIEDALQRFGGDKAKAARFIGWNRQKLYRRMKLFSMPSDYGQTV